MFGGEAWHLLHLLAYYMTGNEIEEGYTTSCMC
jgi:hypothetical protein